MRPSFYQQGMRGEFKVECRNSEKHASFHIIGFADAVSSDAVLEITSRDGQYQSKVQQAHLYASLWNVSTVYNYYIEERLLVRRTRSEEPESFLQRTAEHFCLERLPGLREPVSRSVLYSDYAIQAYVPLEDDAPPLLH